jgi:hypothetical protein
VCERAMRDGLFFLWISMFAVTPPLYSDSPTHTPTYTHTYISTPHFILSLSVTCIQCVLYPSLMMTADRGLQELYIRGQWQSGDVGGGNVAVR